MNDLRVGCTFSNLGCVDSNFGFESLCVFGRERCCVVGVVCVACVGDVLAEYMKRSVISA
jgi:hypothetical protein